MDSIINNEKYCLICGTTINLHKHHIFGGPNRQNSEEDGLWIYLCAKHHNMSDDSVHFNSDMNMSIKRLGQIQYEKRYSRDDFMKRYGKNYL